MYNIPKEQYEFLKLELVHKEYARAAGLMLHEYDLVFNDELLNDIEIGGDKTKVVIALKCHPLAHRDRFMGLLHSMFKKHPIDWTHFKGIRATLRKDDREKFHSLAISDAFARVDQDSKRLPKFSTRYVTFLELTDHATKKTVSVQVTGSSFEAMPKALKLMYGREE